MRNRKEKERHEYYPTPYEAIELARPLLSKDKNWWEPCAGDGRILRHFDNVVLGTDILKKFLNPHARILSKKRTSVSAVNQRKLAEAVKRARFMGLLPYIAR